MKGIEVRAPGGSEQLQVVSLPVPVPGPDEVLISVSAAGINRPDVLQRQGKYPVPQGASPLLGLEVAGTVVSVGARVVSWKSGDRVCALTPGGGYAEFCVAPASCCLRIPKGWSAAEAASLPEALFTVWSNVWDRADFQAGQSLLVHGGTSGIGVTAIQMARALGHTVYATAGSDVKCQACVSLGATHAINYKTEDFSSEISRVTGGRGVDVILDMVGGDYISKNLGILADDGKLVYIAFLKGARDNVNFGQLLLRRLTITGSTLRPRSVAFKSAIAAKLQERIWPLLESGAIKPVIHKTFALVDIARAHDLMEQGSHIGKLMLVIEEA